MNKNLNTIRTDQPLYTPTAGDLLLISASGNSRAITLDELSNYINGQTISDAQVNSAKEAMIISTTTNQNSGAIIWNSSVTDTDTFFTGAAPTRLTIPAGVTKVELKFNAVLSASANVAPFELHKNGVIVQGGFSTLTPDTAGDAFNVSSAILTVTPGDYFEVYSAGTNYNIDLSKTWFSIRAVEWSNP